MYASLKKRSEFISFFILGTILLVGCSSSLNQPIAKDIPTITPKAEEILSLQDSGDVKFVDPDVVINNADGSEVRYGPPGTLPIGFPSDVPVFPGDLKNLTWAIIKSPSDSALSFNVSILMDEAIVLGWFKARLESNSWKIGTVSPDPNDPTGIGVIMDATKGTRSIKVFINPYMNSPQTTISFLFVVEGGN
jgi:hypothetical protein